MLTITVPASSANLGLGFDCLGLALDLNLTVTVGQKTTQWEVIHPFGVDIPADRHNLIVKTALLVDPEIQPHQLTVTSDIPLARGLGSSSSALVAGLALGHFLAEGKINRQQLLGEAAALEGHPDNVAPTIFGGLQLTNENFHDVKSTRLPLDDDLIAFTFIPSYPLKTDEARAALPAEYGRKTATLQAERLANLVVAAFQNDLTAFQHLVEKDLVHEPYRAKLAPEFLTIRKLAHEHGLAGTYLSGAGPTVVSLQKPADAKRLESAVQALNLDGEIKLLSLQQSGFQFSGHLD